MKQKNISVNDDFVINKILIVITMAFLGLLALMFFDKNVSYGLNTVFIYQKLLPAICVLSSVGAVIGGIIAYIRRSEWDKEKMRLFSGRNIAVISFIVLLATVYLYKFDFAQAIRVLYILIPAMAVYYLIFHIYQKEFFTHSVVCGASAGALYLLKSGIARGNLKDSIILAIVYFVLLIAATAVTIWLKNKNGTVSCCDKKIEVLAQTTNYKLLFATYAMVALLFAVTFALQIPVLAYYLAFSVLAYLLILAVYFTTRLM